MGELQKWRILVYDDRPEDLENVRQAFDPGRYEVECYHVSSEQARVHLIHRLQTEWWHLIIADLKLKEGASKALGIEMLAESDPVIPKVIWTNYVEDYRTEILQALARNNHSVDAVNYADKADGTDDLIEKVEHALSTGSSYIDMEMRLQDDEVLTRNLIQGIKPYHQRLEDARNELRDLMRKLFSGFHLTSLKRLSYPTESVIVAKVVLVNQARITSELIVACGPKVQIKQREQNYREYLLGKSSFGFDYKYAETLHYGVLACVISHRIDEYESFGKLFVHKPTEKLKEYLQATFDHVLSPLLNGYVRTFTENEHFEDYYRDFLELTDDQDLFRRNLYDLLRKHPLVKTKANLITIRLESNRWLAAKQRRSENIQDPSFDLFGSTSLFSIHNPPEQLPSHGDVDEARLFIHSGNGVPWLFVSHKTGYGFSLRDFVSLEASIILRLIVGDLNRESAYYCFTLLRICLSPQKLSDGVRLELIESEPSVPETVRKALELVDLIRREAAAYDANEDMMPYYYGGLMFHAAKMIQQMPRRPTPSPKHLPHAALALCLIVDRLAYWESNWRAPFAVSSNSNESSWGWMPDGYLRTPYGIMGVKKNSKEGRLMDFFLLNPNNLITPDEIADRVIGRSNVNDNLIQKRVSRLRKDIGDVRGNENKFRHIVTHSGEGYEFIP